MTTPPVERGYDRWDRLDTSLHDLTNALASARAYGELLYLRTKAGSTRDPTPLLESLLGEIARVSDISRAIRLEIYDEYVPRSPATREA